MKKQLLVREMGNVVEFYVKVRESEKSVWLQEIGSRTNKGSILNNGHEWEVLPDPSVKVGDVFRKLKTPQGRVKMGQYDFLQPYKQGNKYTERNF